VVDTRRIELNGFAFVEARLFSGSGVLDSWTFDAVSEIPVRDSSYLLFQNTRMT